MRVLGLGSCRIHLPLNDARRRGDIDYLNWRMEGRHSALLHDVHEAIQFVLIMRGELAMPGEIRVFAYEGRVPSRRAMGMALQRTDHVVVEACTDKHYQLDTWTLNVNEIHRQIVERGGAAAREWWEVIDRGERPPEALVCRVEAELRARWWGRWHAGGGHGRVLRDLAFRYLSAQDIADGLVRLRALIAKPILIVPHVAVRLADGQYLGERLQHIEKTIEAARRVGIPILDPRALVERDGQARALANRGFDFNHYSSDYVPVVGRELVDALRRYAGGPRR